MKNLKGEPSNVFDAEFRKPATGSAPYKVFYDKVDGACPCEGCWCNESYPLSEEPDPENPDQPLGPYVVRVEESYVYEPRLHIDARAVSIVARRDRMWDNNPVENPFWAEMMIDPIYVGPQKSIIRNGNRVRLPVGWRAVWKHSFERGDESKWAGLGVDVQYRYHGQWHETDVIQVAQRPVVPGAWSAQGWTEGAWVDGAHQQWRISQVAQASDQGPAHPSIFSDREGRLVVAYEHGTSDNPNLPGHNVLYVRNSIDGGVAWSEPEAVGAGYMPQLAVTDGGERALVHYSAEPNGEGAIRMVRSPGPAGSWRASEKLNRATPAPVHWKTHGQNRGPLIGVPALSTHEELHIAAWVQASDSIVERERIVIARASLLEEVDRYHVTTPQVVVSAQSTQYSVTAVNKYSMVVNTDESVAISAVKASNPTTPFSNRASRTKHLDTTASEPTNSLSPANAHTPSSNSPSSNPSSLKATPPSSPSSPTPPHTASSHGASFNAAPSALALTSGQGTFWASWEGDGIALTIGNPSKEAEDPETPIKLLPGNVRGNYDRALTARDQMLVESFDEATGHTHVRQLEYTLDESNRTALASRERLLAPRLWEEPLYKDAKHLAGFDRVWAYTQGIALAQLARSPKQEDRARAPGLAHFLCDRAERGPSETGAPIIKGWPFSWNTDGDDWRDARLVTGANAWAVQGLGIFLASEAIDGVPQEEMKALRQCYAQALQGLAEHQREVIGQDGRVFTLMTAGWTVKGLQAAADPAKRFGGQSQNATTEEGERWSYYSVLDAVGYDTLKEDQLPQIDRFREQGADGTRTPMAPLIIENAELLSWLKARTKANNVVTEHNLDTLSVLNHALQNKDTLGLDNAKELEAWRNSLRNGIFTLLWDATGWSQDLEKALREHALSAEKKTRIKDALSAQDLGRMITGGSLTPEGDAFSFTPSGHVAIDNCSWLALSVDYASLSNEFEQRLSTCLEYTRLQFAKSLEFESKRYYGTHYFQNAFRDPYIDPSELQEASFHLEATTGLILGLLYFAEARPQDPRAEQFRDEALRLWAGVQAFVRDHGFPYSSQRIQDLSTRLSSSTAIIWFIDIRDHLHSGWSTLDRPLYDYAHDVDEAALDQWAEEVLDEAFLAPQAPTPSVGNTESSAGHLVSSETHEGTSYTLIEDQALAVIATTSEGRLDDALLAAEALLSVAAPTDGASSASLWYFPSKVKMESRASVDGALNIGTQAIATYALAWVLGRHPGLPEALALRLQDVLEGVLLTLEVFYDQGQTTDGANLYGEPELARTEDNVLAYFALKEASLAFEHAGKLDLKDRYAQNALRLQNALQSLLWDEEAGRPRIAFPPSAEGQGEGAHRAMALYAAFAASLGDRVKAEAALVGTRFFDDLPPTRPSPWALTPKPHPIDRPWLESGVASLFAHRSLTPFDPRSGRIATLKQFRIAKTASLGLSARLGALVSGRVPGFLGQKNEPTAFDTRNLAGTRIALTKAYAETVGGLLMSPDHTHLFDHAVTALVQIRFLQDGVDRGVDPRAWLRQAGGRFGQELPMRVVSELLRVCALDKNTQHALGQYLGLTCETISRAFSDRLWDRGIAGHDLGRLEALGVILSEDDQASLWQAHLAQVTNPRPIGLTVFPKTKPDDSLDTWALLAQAPDPLVPDNATRDEIRSAVKTRLKEAIWAGIRQTTEQGDRVEFALDGLDPIAVFHPESPVFFSRPALELRVAQAFAPSIDYQVEGTSTPAPDQPLGGDRLRTQRALRRFVHQHAEGQLARLAEDSGLSVDILHQVLRTGVSSAGFLEAITAPYSHSERKAQALRDAFPAPPGPTPIYVPRTAAGMLYSLTVGPATNPAWQQLVKEILVALVPVIAPNAPSGPNDGPVETGIVDPFSGDPCGLETADLLGDGETYTVLCARVGPPPKPAFGHSPGLDTPALIPIVGSLQEALDALWFYSPWKPAIIVEQGALFAGGRVYPRIRGDFVDLIVRADSASEGSDHEGSGDVVLGEANRVGLIEVSSAEREATPDGYLCSHDPELVDLTGQEVRALIRKWLKNGRDAFHLDWRTALSPEWISVYRDLRRMNASDELTPKKGIKVNFKKDVRPIPGLTLYCIALSELEKENVDSRTAFTIEPPTWDPRSLGFRAFLGKKPRTFLRKRKIQIDFNAPSGFLLEGDYAVRGYVTIFKMRPGDLQRQAPKDQIVHTFDIEIRNAKKDGVHEFSPSDSLLGKDLETFLSEMDAEEELYASLAIDIQIAGEDIYGGSVTVGPVEVYQKGTLNANSVDQPPPPVGSPVGTAATSLAALLAYDWSTSFRAYGAEEGLGTSEAPVNVVSLFPSAANIARPELVQYNALVLLEAATLTAGREALKILLVNVIAIGVHLGVATAVSDAEVDIMVETIMGGSRPNIIVVEPEVDFEVPLGAFEYTATVDRLPAGGPEEIYKWVPGALAKHSQGLDYRLSTNLLSNLGFYAGSAVKEEWAQKLRALFTNKIPYDVVLRKTSNGVEIYRAVRWLEPYTFEAPLGTVIQLGPDAGEPRVVYTHPVGFWHQWYRDEISSSQVPQEWIDVHVQAVDQWVFDHITHVPGRLSWNAWKSKQFSRYGGRSDPLAVHVPPDIVPIPQSPPLEDSEAFVLRFEQNGPKSSRDAHRYLFEIGAMNERGELVRNNGRAKPVSDRVGNVYTADDAIDISVQGHFDRFWGTIDGQTVRDVLFVDHPLLPTEMSRLHASANREFALFFLPKYAVWGLSVGDLGVTNSLELPEDLTGTHKSVLFHSHGGRGGIDTLPSWTDMINIAPWRLHGVFASGALYLFGAPETDLFKGFSLEYPEGDVHVKTWQPKFQTYDAIQPTLSKSDYMTTAESNAMQSPAPAIYGRDSSQTP